MNCDVWNTTYSHSFGFHFVFAQYKLYIIQIQNLVKLTKNIISTLIHGARKQKYLAFLMIWFGILQNQMEYLVKEQVFPPIYTWKTGAQLLAVLEEE